MYDNRQLYTRWYKTARWVRRSRQQLQQFPLCAMCLAKGVTTAAVHADHVQEHKGDAHLFWFGELQSLCFDCHNTSKRQVELRGFSNEIGDDGLPLDPAHPFNHC